MDSLSPDSIGNEKLTAAEIRNLFELYRSGDLRARDKLVGAFMPLVYSICSKYENKGVPFEDLVQEGCYGLLKALEKFDATRGCFTTYAYPYILKYVRDAQIKQNSFLPIVYESDYFYQLQKYLRVLDELKESLETNPTDKEIAAALRTTELKIRKLRHNMYAFFPIDSLTGPDTLPRVPANCTTESPESVVMRRVLDLSCLGIYLSEKEKTVLCRHLGFTDEGTPEALRDIAEDLGVTLEYVRLLYKKAISRIKIAVEERGYTINTIHI